MLAWPLAFLLIALPSCARADELPDADVQSQDKIPWRDPHYSLLQWNYLQQLDPLLQGRWIGLSPQEQSRLLVLAGQKANPMEGPQTSPGAPPTMIMLTDRLVFDNPREKQLSDYWNQYFRDNFQNNPVGRNILDHLKEGLPPMKIAKLQPQALADFSPEAVFIQVNSVHLAQEILFLDPSSGVTDNPPALMEYLLSHPNVTSDVFKSYRSIEAHEATHAVQSAAFRDDLLPSQDRADYIEAEKHAFTVQHRYTLAELEIDPEYLASQSPITVMSRNALVNCLIDYDQCMANIGPAYAQAHELGWAIGKGNDSKTSSARILERMKGFYDDFEQQTRQDWKEKNTRGLLLLAERLASPNSSEALRDLLTLENLLPAQIHGQGELAPRFSQAVDRSVSAYAALLQASAPSLDKILEVDLACRHYGRNFPPELTQTRNSAYRAEIARLRALPDIATKDAQAGRYMAHVVGDTDAEKFFATK